MREIKFRIRYKKKGIEYCVIIPINNLIAEDLKDSIGLDEIVSIEELTGLEDKNGKEIYEGDIVKFNNLDLGEFGNGEVIIKDGMVKVKTNMHEKYILKCCYVGHKVEVIGNTYKNPELLEKEK